LSESDKVKEIIKESLVPFLQKVKKNGLKKTIENALPGFCVDKFLIETVKRSLKLVKIVKLGCWFGKFNVYYKHGAVVLDPVGIVRLIIEQVIITDEKIIKTFEDIFKQIEKNFLQDENHLIEKIDKILKNLTDKELFEISNSDEKNLYDLVLAILFSYYSSVNKEFPDWLELALKKVDKKELAKDFLDFLKEVILKTFSNLIENIHLNYRITLDSKVLRFFLNKNTSQGKIAHLLKIFKFDARKVIESFSKNYAGESFLIGLGEHLVDMISNFVCGVSDQVQLKSEDKFNFTVCPGRNIFSRRLRWFGSSGKDEHVEISNDSEFNKYSTIDSHKKKIILARPTVLNLGTVAKYQIEQKFKYSASLSNFKLDTKYYIRVKRNSGNLLSEFSVSSDKFCDFIAISDSQGMIENDYNKFLKILSKVLNNFKNTQFVIHLGDFVDDGNNENYWDFILNSKIWSQIPILPVAGNHEAKFHPTLNFAGIENSIINHFNIEFPEQDNLDKGVYYFFEQNDCIFVFLNTNIYGGLGREQIKWVNNILEKSEAKWKILFTHKNIYSNGPHQSDSGTLVMRKEINEICSQFNIDLVISGHEHVYSRTKSLCYGVPTREYIEHEETIINPDGTTFITLGPIGVKNYKIHNKNKIINKVIFDLNCPSFAKIKVTENEMEVQVYKFEYDSDVPDVIDKFKIKKDPLLLNDGKIIKKQIDNLPIIPWRCMKNKIDRIFKNYNMLSKDEKFKISSINKLNIAKKYSLSYNKILNGDIAIVFDETGFLNSINNEKITVILINCEKIKFKNKFGFFRSVIIERDMLIKGNAKLEHISFIIKPHVTFHVGGSLIVDNNRKIFSIYPAISSFILHNKGTLVIQNTVWIEQSYGLGFNNIVKILGKNAKIFINSENFKKIPSRFINKKFNECVFNQFL